MIDRGEPDIGALTRAPSGCRHPRREVPIAVSAAGEIGVSPRPVSMSVAVAAAASFLTPVATPANVMVMGPGGHRFGDCWRLGLCLLALFFVVAIFLVPVFWSF